MCNRKGECILTGLASWLNISSDGAHNAVYDVTMMVKIIKSLKTTTDQIIEHQKTWSDSIASIQNGENVARIMKTLIPLSNLLFICWNQKEISRG